MSIYVTHKEKFGDDTLFIEVDKSEVYLTDSTTKVRTFMPPSQLSVEFVMKSVKAGAWKMITEEEALAMLNPTPSQNSLRVGESEFVQEGTAIEEDTAIDYIVGDKVKVTNPDNKEDVELNKVGIIREVRNTYYRIEFKDSGENGYFSDHELCITEEQPVLPEDCAINFKVGDKVEITNPDNAYNDDYQNLVGTITGITIYDKDEPFGHYTVEFETGGSCYADHELTLVKKKEDPQPRPNYRGKINTCNLFKEGDRVVITDADNDEENLTSRYNGRTAVIEKLHKDHYTVIFDDNGDDYYFADYELSPYGATLEEQGVGTESTPPYKVGDKVIVTSVERDGDKWKIGYDLVEEVVLTSGTRTV